MFVEHWPVNNFVTVGSQRVLVSADDMMLCKFLNGLWDLAFCERHIVITVAVHQGRTIVKIDFPDPYQVKATSVLCLLGFGIGFGSVLLYRLYKRCSKTYTITNDVTRTSRKRHKVHYDDEKSSCNPENKGVNEHCCHDDTTEPIGVGSDGASFAHVTKSDKVAMGNNVQHATDHPVHYDHYSNGVSFADFPREGSPWHPAAAAVNIPRPSSASVNRDDVMSNSSEETYLEFLSNKFGTLIPGAVNGELDIARFLKNTDVDAVSGDVSLMGNFSPTSLYEKNIHYSDVAESLDHDAKGYYNKKVPFNVTEPSPDRGRRSASPTLYRRQNEFDSPFKRSVRSAGSCDRDDDELEELFKDEEEVNDFFDKIEQELLSLKSEIADMDGTIKTLATTAPEVEKSPRHVDVDFGAAGTLLRKYSRSGQNSRAGSVDVAVTSDKQQSFYPPYQVHVHVHVHDDRKAFDLPLPGRYPCLSDRDEESMSSSSLAESQPISCESSPCRDDEPIKTQDITNNNGCHDNVISQTASMDRDNVAVKNLGEIHDIVSYADREIRGNTDAAKTILKGYYAIPGRLSKSRLRVIRGDHYCAIRATLYHIFVRNVDFRKTTGTIHDVIQKLQDRSNSNHGYLRDWSFGNRLPVKSSEQVTRRMIECLETLYKQFSMMAALNCSEREVAYCAAMNASPDADVRMMEAVKILMMLNAIARYEVYTTTGEVPLFVWLMFARDGSSTPRQLFTSHIDKVGFTHGLEQVELFLLADTLGVVLEVVRPSQFGEEDYITYLPSATNSDRDSLTLIADEDGHYNVLLT